MERPLVLPVLALAVGVLASDQLHPPTWLAALLAVAGLAGWMWPGRGRWHRLLAACAAVGCWHHAVWSDGSDPMAAARVLPAEPALGWVTGRITDTGEDRVRPGGGDGVRQARRFEMAARWWRPRMGEPVPVRGVVRVMFRDGAGIEPRRGQEVEVFGIVSEPAAAMLPGGFDLRRHLRARGIVRAVESENREDWRVLGEVPERGWAERFLPWAHGRLQQGLPDDAASRLIRAMVLGWRGGMEEEWRETFVGSGTLHVFAISGLHIGLVASVLVQVLRLMRLGRAGCGWVALPVTWFYVAATGWQSSAVRAGVMATVVIVGWALRRPSDLLNSLAAAAGILLVIEPGQLFQPGFQLSFGVVTGMVLWTGRVGEWLGHWTRPDPLVPDSVRSGWQLRMAEGLRVAGLNLAGTLSAWAASLPLCIHHFHVVSVVSLGANLLVVPLAGMALVSGMGSLAVAGVWSGGSEWLNQSAWVWMRAMMWVGEAASRIPWGHWQQSAPSGWWWMGYVWWGCVLLPGWNGGWRRLDWRWALGGLWVGAVLIGTWQTHQTVRMTAMPWGAGVCVESGLGRVTLFDCGNRVMTRRILPEWLKVRGVDVLAAGVACSGESRFAGGWPGLMEALPMEAWWTVPELRKGGALRAAQEAARARGIPIRRLVAGRSVEGWEVLWPLADGEERRSDAASLVLLGRPGGVRCLLVPGLNPEAQRRLVAREGDGLKAEVLIAGMPSLGEPLVDELLGAVSPEVIVVLAAERPAMHRVSVRCRQRLRSRGVPVWFTDEAGAVTVGCRGGRWWVKGQGGVLTMQPGPGREGDAHQERER